MIALLLGEESLKSYGIQIGGTLEFLLGGVPFDVMKALGHWSSDTFTLYLQQHATIIAPYIQDHPMLHHDASCLLLVSQLGIMAQYWFHPRFRCSF